MNIFTPVKGFFALPSAVRLAVYLPLLALVFLLALRQIEFQLTYHPTRYQPGPAWTPPQNGEEVWFSGPGGQQLHGWFIRAQTAKATILYCHGNGGNLTNVGWIAREFAARGFDVLLFDYRGYGRSAGSLTDEWGLYADGAAAYDYLTRERGVRPDKLVINGLSLGTAVAVDLAAQRPCAALVVESGLSSASEMAASALPWLPRWLHFLGKNRFESERKIAHINCPVLITHGTRDEVIPVAQGRRLYAAAREPKQLLLIEGGDHNLVGKGGAPYLDKITAFLRHSLK
jgi:hypothetical protein